MKKMQNKYKKIQTKYRRWLISKATSLVFCIGVSFTCSFGFVNAKQVREVTGNDELLLEISKRDITRLSVENDKISSLQFSNGIIDVTTLLYSLRKIMYADKAALILTLIKGLLSSSSGASGLIYP